MSTIFLRLHTSLNVLFLRLPPRERAIPFSSPAQSAAFKNTRFKYLAGPSGVYSFSVSFGQKQVSRASTALGTSQTANLNTQKTMQYNISAVRPKLISINTIISVIFSCFQLLLTSCWLLSASVMKINELCAVWGSYSHFIFRLILASCSAQLWLTTLTVLPLQVISELRHTSSSSQPTQPVRKTAFSFPFFPALNSTCANVQICRRTLMASTINIAAVATRVVLSQ